MLVYLLSLEFYDVWYAECNILQGGPRPPPPNLVDPQGPQGVPKGNRKKMAARAEGKKKSIFLAEKIFGENF